MLVFCCHIVCIVTNSNKCLRYVGILGTKFNVFVFKCVTCEMYVNEFSDVVQIAAIKMFC